MEKEDCLRWAKNVLKETDQNVTLIQIGEPIVTLLHCSKRHDEHTCPVGMVFFNKNPQCSAGTHISNVELFFFYSKQVTHPSTKDGSPLFFLHKRKNLYWFPKFKMVIHFRWTYLDIYKCLFHHFLFLK